MSDIIENILAESMIRVRCYMESKKTCKPSPITIKLHSMASVSWPRVE